MIEPADARVAIVVPIGPGKESAIDTLQSVEVFCPEPHVVVVVDDQTEDGTYEALIACKKPHWEVFRNNRRHGILRLVHSLCFAYQQVLERTECDLILRLDQDALVIKPGLLPEAIAFKDARASVGMFGVHEVDYNRPRNFECHRRLFTREARWYRSLVGWGPSWSCYLKMAERNGYQRGDNVFGGAYFITRECLLAARKIGALDVPWNWHSRVMEDVYFSMIAVAAGFHLGHFAAPDGPLCMEWRGLPLPAHELVASKFKLVHSVDKGPNTDAAENVGKSARQVFREFRAKASKHALPNPPPEGHCLRPV